MKASGLRHFRYIAFPPVVFEVPVRAAEVEAVVLPEPAPAEPELVLAPENTLPAPPEPAPILPPLAPQVAAPPPPAPEPIPDPPSWSLPQPVVRQPLVRQPAGLRLLVEATAAAAPPPAPKPPEAPRRFTLLDDIQTELRPRRARTGRRAPGDLP